MSLIFEEHVFDPRPRFPFLVTTKCYPNLGDEQDVFTLILAHGNGFPSELWEPIIERIFATENAKPDGLRIREAWAIDAPNHGDAAALNVTLLKSGAYDHLCELFRRWLPCTDIKFWVKSAGRIMPEQSIWFLQDWGLLPMPRTSPLGLTSRTEG